MRSLDKSIAFVFVAFITMIGTVLPTQLFANDYCLVPPYVKRDVKPNVMVIMDNAVDMGEPAYCTKDASYSSNQTCNDNYNPATTYNGYYKPALKYSYSGNKFTPDTNGIYSGNLLNWATTSKYDLLENILVGGISTSRQSQINTLVSKSNVWKKTFSYVVSGNTHTCIVNVNNANVVFTEPTSGSCGLLDSPAAVPPNDPAFVLLETDLKFAENPQPEPESRIPAEPSVFRNAASSVLGVLTSIADFLVSDAEAASPLRISGGPSSLTNGTECTAGYTITISAAGGTNSSYTWSIDSGNLPPGLTLGASGTPDTTISGTPTTSGTYNFTIRVRDSGNNTDTKSYSITVNAVTFSITTGSPLSNGTKGVAYSATLAATAGVCSPYTWSISAGSLPPGLTISNAGVISGTPTVSGSSTFTVKVRNAPNTADSTTGRFATKDFTITISDTAQITITTDSPLPDGAKNQAYNTTITVINSNNGVNSWTITSGALPPGLTLKCTGWGTGMCGMLNIDTALISGTPTNAGTYSFRITANDNGGRTASKDFTLTITTGAIRTTGNLNVKICAGDYSVNCTSGGHNGGTGALKSGLIDQFWSQARFGVMDFSKSQNVYSQPTMENCIEQNPNDTPDPNFLTAVENAVSIDPTTVLVNGEYEAVDYYQSNTTNNCNPFIGAQQCTKSFVLIITAGVGANNPPSVETNHTPEVFTTGMPSVCSSATLTNLAKNACYGFNKEDLRSDVSGRQYVSTYIVNTLGTAATTGYNPDNAPVTSGDVLKQAAMKGGGIYYEVQDPALLKSQLETALQDIIKRAAAGTAASVLASGEGSGANLVQAVFYPRKQFVNNEIEWIGRLTNLWYFVDPNLNSSSIREEDGILDADGAKVLTLQTDQTSGTAHHDNVVQLFFDTTNEVTKAHRWKDTNGDGIIDAQIFPDVEFETLGNLWEAGSLLWSRTSARTIYTTIGSGRVDFSATNAASLRSYLTVTADDEAEAVIRYVHGEDNPVVNGVTWTYRPRSVQMSDGGPFHTWKLGDVLNSTPKISSWLPLNTYHKMYADSTYGVPGQDPSLAVAANNTKYITSDTYRARNMIYAGANDGMLHAFKLGTLELKWTGQGDFDKARLTGTDLGKEMWAFIPKHALPYLKYTADPAYCHVYTIDLTPFIFDASIGAPGAVNVSTTDRDVSQWRTILIGGMRFGGGCRKQGTCAAGGNCVNTPAIDPVLNADNTTNGLGYSSYFALDITDQNNPVVLWEFADDRLGYSTTGPTVVRVSVKDASNNPLPAKNGKWFVVLGSGPTGPIDNKQFMGRSDQQLRLFVLDLKSGNLVRPIEKDWNNNNLPANAFAGSMMNSSLDTDLDYQDDVVYVPYVKLAATTWTDGGVLRLSTHEDTNPGNWEVSTLIDGIGPVTSAVSKLQNNSSQKLWVFFGTGRYFYTQNGQADDATGSRQLFGIKEPCFGTSGFGPDCHSSAGTLDNVTNIGNVHNTDADSRPGWFIELDHDSVPDASVHAERVITDPVAATTGVVFFTTFKPYSDECALGGKSSIWAVKYNSGGDASALLKGQALIQVSTGSIEQLKLSEAFRDSVTGLNTGNRKTAGMEGVPPTAQGLSIMTTPAPVKRVLHVKER